MSLVPLDEKKILFLDLETTGLEPEKYSVWQLAGIITIDDKIVEKFDIKVSPKKRSISKEAKELLKIDNPSEFFSKFQSYQEGFNQLDKIFSKYIDRYDKHSKFIIIGQNVDFDVKHLIEFFKENENKYFGSWFSGYRIDIIQKAVDLILRGKMDIVKLFDLGNNLKLDTLAKYFNLNFDHHDALADIETTYKIFKLLNDLEDNSK